MVKIDGRSIDSNRPGAALILTGPSSTDWVEPFANGVTVRVQKSSTALIVEGLPGSDLATMPDEARIYADRALDLIAVRSGGASSLQGTSAPAVCWATSAGVCRLRTYTESQSAFAMTIGGGPTAYPVNWHESMRYFRMSQAGTDLLDSFRNLYLALESILSYLEPVRQGAKGRYEGESLWTQRALRAASHRILQSNTWMTFDRYLPSSLQAVSDPVDAVFQEIYVGIRTAIFHAKNSRPYLLPQDLSSRALVQSALARYSTLYTDLAEVLFGARFLRSGLAPAGFEAMAEAIAPKLTVGLSVRSFEVDDFDAQAASELNLLSTRWARSLDESHRLTVIGQSVVEGLRPISGVRSIGARLPGGEPALVEPLGLSLDLSGVDEVECYVSIRITGAGTRIRFAT